ncbi:MAG: hypothetical protein H7Y32_02425, partial [Chloroflexales bacterium]|nr:hypothetical protein [Chloroflexales bacterium]
DEIGGLQFYSLTTDRALDPAAWREWRGASGYEPLLRRMDARSYQALDYLAALQLGAGRLLVCTLRFEGGAGDAASELAQHAAGQALLWRLLRWLRG